MNIHELLKITSASIVGMQKGFDTTAESVHVRSFDDYVKSMPAFGMQVDANLAIESVHTTDAKQGHVKIIVDVKTECSRRFAIVFIGFIKEYDVGWRIDVTYARMLHDHFRSGELEDMYEVAAVELNKFIL